MKMRSYWRYKTDMFLHPNSLNRRVFCKLKASQKVLKFYKTRHARGLMFINIQSFLGDCIAKLHNSRRMKRLNSHSFQRDTKKNRAQISLFSIQRNVFIFFYYI